MRQRVMIDVDGVLANFLHGWSRLASQYLCVELPSRCEDQPTWDMGLDKTDEDFLWERVGKDPNFWFGLPSLLSNEELLRLSWLTQDHDVYFVTSRHNDYALQGTVAWLGVRFVYSGSVILSRKKGLIAKAIDATFAIDDKPTVIREILKHQPSCQTFIRDWPYNREVEGARRVSSFMEFLEAVQKE